MERNNENIRQHPDYYKRRQSICEHPFGTIKRQWGYTNTLLKGLQKVNREMNLIMLVYNLRRTISMLDFEKMLTAIHNWTPDYRRVFRFLQKAIHNRIMKLIDEAKHFYSSEDLNIKVA